MIVHGEGWYVDLTTGEATSVHEHAYDVFKNPKAFRIDPREIAHLQAWNVKDRDAVRRLMLHRGFARVRSHGNSVVVEFDMKVDDAVPVVIPFLVENFPPTTWVAFNDVANNKQYTDIQIQDLEDQEKLDAALGSVREHKSIKLSSLYEDYDITPVGSKNYAAGTEKLVRGPKSGAGPGVQPPEKGDISRISDVGSRSYIKDTVKPSEKLRKDQRHPRL